MNTADKTQTKKLRSQPKFWLGMGLSALSGILIAATMPNFFNLGWLGWIALVPMLIAIEMFPEERPNWLTLPFAFIWTVAVHRFFASIFNNLWLGYLLMLGVGIFYSWLINAGIGLQRKVSGELKLLALPVVWSALEFIKFIAPIVRGWWFVLLPKSQWGFPAGLQVLSLTGFPGLSFLLMLSNVALATLLFKLWQDRRLFRPSVIALVVIAALLIWGSVVIPAPPQETFTMAATVDLVAQDMRIIDLKENSVGGDVSFAVNPEYSQALIDINGELTNSVSDQGLAFVGWPEELIADADDPEFMRQIGAIAQETGAYVITNAYAQISDKLYNTVLMIGPDGKEAGRRYKIHLFPTEPKQGFSAGPKSYESFDTPFGKVGLGICYDYHFLDVVHNLARNGAKIFIMPTNDDFNGDPDFPKFHATDAVFRAVEHRAVFATSTASGVSIVVDPYGRIMAMSDVNKRQIVTGEVFTVPDQTLYTRLGEWFGWLMVAGAAVMIGAVVWKREKKHRR